MRQRSYVDDFGNLDTGSVNSSDSGLTTVTRALYISLYLSQAKIVSHFGAILGSHLCCIRSVLLRTSKTHLSGRRPGDNLTFAICQRNNDVVEG